MIRKPIVVKRVIKGIVLGPWKTMMSWELLTDIIATTAITSITSNITITILLLLLRDAIAIVTNTITITFCIFITSGRRLWLFD